LITLDKTRPLAAGVRGDSDRGKSQGVIPEERKKLHKSQHKKIKGGGGRERVLLPSTGGSPLTSAIKGEYVDEGVDLLT